MRSQLPLLLYVLVVGLLGFTGWTFYEMLPKWKKEYQDASMKRGIDAGKDLVASGKGQGTVTTDWRYSRATASWWAGIKEVNLIGKLPPPPPEAKGPERPAEVVVKVDQRPLDTIIELVSLVSDGQAGGTGGNTHVIVRYKPEANVQPPEWWLRENTPATPGAGGPPGMPRDVASAPRPAAVRGGAQRPPASPMPAATPNSVTGREIVQKVWIEGANDVRQGARLWPPFEHIRLVRVAGDAQSAFFVRELPNAPAEAPPPEPEELLKTTMNLSQDVLQELRRLQGRDGARGVGGDESSAAPAAPANAWRDVEETTRFGNQFHIGRQDERGFREGGDDFLEKVYVDTYVSKTTNLRGLSVRNVEPQLANRFGITTGDVLLEVNGNKVENRAQTVQLVKRDYNNGVRTFTTKWLSNGQVVERVYQAPDR
jgi:hypothetical protein